MPDHSSTHATHIAGDWGTTHLRLHLCRHGEILDRAEGPGIGALNGAGPATVLFGAIEAWTNTHGALPIWLAGMVGSRNGWREVPYAACPADIGKLHRALLRFRAHDHDVAIAAGVSCINRLGAPDVMRGEETQILGAIAARPSLGRGRHVIALPGTHTKWAWLEEGRLQSFQTSLSGELYALLAERSTLLKAGGVPGGENDEREGFDAGLRRSKELANVPLSHLLFEVRSRQLIDNWSPTAAGAFLSGLIVGQDVLGALPMFDRASGAAVPIVGAPKLAALYSAALACHGIDAVPLDATALTVAGLTALAQAGSIQE